jgi:predicted deacylase
MTAIEIGSARSRPGELVTGEFDALALPTGGLERLPVVVAQGRQDGPVLWLTTGIHGPEHTGLNIVHQLLSPELPVYLRGTVVAIPALSPAGLRARQREPYYVYADPNRLFPEDTGATATAAEDPDLDVASALEEAYARLFQLIQASASYLIDLHNAWLGSVPFVFRDRVLFRAGRDRREAEALQARTGEMIAAFGLSVVNEFPVRKYLSEKLHRSVSGATLNLGRIPAITVELGGELTPDPAIVAAGLIGVRNVLRWAGMLPGAIEPITGVPVVHPGYPVRRRMHPRVPTSCIVRHLVKPGDILRAGDTVAELRDIYGRPIGEGVVRTQHDGWIIGFTHGVVYYPNQAIAVMAVRDQEPLVAQYPE